MGKIELRGETPGITCMGTKIKALNGVQMVWEEVSRMRERGPSTLRTPQRGIKRDTWRSSWNRGAGVTEASRRVSKEGEGHPCPIYLDQAGVPED